MVHQIERPIQETSTLEELVTEISRFEAIIADWDESQRCVVVGLKRAIEDLHKQALTRLIRSVKQESMTALRHAVEDEVVYGVLHYHELLKQPKLSLQQRIQLALNEVRPNLQNHNGDVELVAIKPPDTVEIRLLGACSNCPASTLTLSQLVEQAIKSCCPEITNIIALKTNKPSHSNPAQKEEWIELTTLDEIPNNGVLTLEIEGTGIILSRIESQIQCYRNACSHFGMRFDTDLVNGDTLTCLYHGFQYKLNTGECLTFPDISLQTYPVKIEDDKVFIQLRKE